MDSFVFKLWGNITRTDITITRTYKTVKEQKNQPNDLKLYKEQWIFWIKKCLNLKALLKMTTFKYHLDLKERDTVAVEFRDNEIMSEENKDICNKRGFFCCWFCLFVFYILFVNHSVTHNALSGSASDWIARKADIQRVL